MYSFLLFLRIDLELGLASLALLFFILVVLRDSLVHTCWPFFLPPSQFLYQFIFLRQICISILIMQGLPWPFNHWSIQLIKLGSYWTLSDIFCSCYILTCRICLLPIVSIHRGICFIFLNLSLLILLSASGLLFVFLNLLHQDVTLFRKISDTTFKIFDSLSFLLNSIVNWKALVLWCIIFFFKESLIVLIYRHLAFILSQFLSWFQLLATALTINKN